MTDKKAIDFSLGLMYNILKEGEFFEVDYDKKRQTAGASCSGRYI